MLSTKSFLTRVSLFAALAVVFASVFANAASAATLYIAGYHFGGQVWSDPGIAPGPIGPAIVNADPDQTIIDVAAENAGGSIYYSYRTIGAAGTIIGKANFDGSGATALITGTEGAQGLALDSVGQKLYWIEPGSTPNTGKVQSASTSGGAVTTIVSGLSGSLEGLSIDVAKNLYYATRITSFAGPGSSEILVGSLSGGAPSVLISSTGFIDGVDVDLVNSKIYWANSANNTIGVANLDVTGLIVSAQNNAFYTTGTGIIEDVEADPIGGHLYWSNFFTDNSVGQSDLANLLNTGTATNVTQNYITGLARNWGLDIAQDAAPAGVPEPSTFVLAALGLAGLGLVAWRRGKYSSRSA